MNCEQGLNLFFPLFSGAFSFEDVLAVGGKEDKLKVEQLQKSIKFDDPVNIQFTSVRQFLNSLLNFVSKL